MFTLTLAQQVRLFVRSLTDGKPEFNSFKLCHIFKDVQWKLRSFLLCTPTAYSDCFTEKLHWMSLLYIDNKDGSHSVFQNNKKLWYGWFDFFWLIFYHNDKIFVYFNRVTWAFILCSLLRIHGTWISLNVKSCRVIVPVSNQGDTSWEPLVLHW